MHSDPIPTSTVIPLAPEITQVPREVTALERLIESAYLSQSDRLQMRSAIQRVKDAWIHELDEMMSECDRLEKLWKSARREPSLQVLLWQSVLLNFGLWGMTALFLLWWSVR